MFYLMLFVLVVGPWIIIVGFAIEIKLSPIFTVVARVAILVVTVTMVIAVAPEVAGVAITLAGALSAKVGSIMPNDCCQIDM